MTKKGSAFVPSTIASLKADGMISAINDLIPYARTVGLEAFFDEAGLVTALRFRESNIGVTTVRTIHGGMIGALLEHAAMLHLIEQTEIDFIPKIVNISVDYLRPSLAADTFARGQVIRQGRRIANVRVEAWQDAPERPVAAAHAHFLLA
jgi:acyl-coenzyme A thioesterase PaaI-like protein